MAHAFYTTGEGGIENAHAYVRDVLQMEVRGNPDVIDLSYRLFSVDDARKLASFAEGVPTKGDTKVIILSAGRFFHEAQNTLLKLLEEPPAGTIFILAVPSIGILLSTLRSRLSPLPNTDCSEEPETAENFLSLSEADQAKYFGKLADRSKASNSNKEDQQTARIEALTFVQSMIRIAHARFRKFPEDRELQAFLKDLESFARLLHERSTSLKLIFEHLLLTIPRSLKN